MTNEVTIDIDSNQIISALEDTRDYKVFEDNTDGLETALNWILETEMINGTASGFILDRLRPDEVIPYVWDIYPNKTMDDLIENKHNQLNLRCDDLIQAIIKHKSTDYVFNQIGSNEENMELLGHYIENNCSEKSLDNLLGPIYSDKIIRHLENSIDGMTIRKSEMPTEEMIEVLLSYFDEFDFRTELLKQMRRHGIMLETIIRAYIDDEREEECEAHDSY